MKKSYLLLFTCFCLLFFTEAFSQSKIKPFHAGIYQGGIVTQVAFGTDFEKQYFGELRFTASDVLNYPFGVEGYFNRNLKRTDWYNIHLGVMLGVMEFGNVRAGLPLGVTIKPIEGHRNFGVLLEATPNFFIDNGFGLRGDLGIRYSFGG